MNQELPETVVEFAASVERAFDRAGGVELCRQAERRPEVRTEVLDPLLERLGAHELQPLQDVEAALCAAELCRLAGAVALPYPIEGLFGRVEVAGSRWAALVDRRDPWIEHADLPGPWLAVDERGESWRATVVPTARNRTLAPFVQRVRLEAGGDRRPDVERALLMDLTSCRVLGGLEGALALTVAHVRERRQFGRPLSAFQAVQFHVVDAEVSVRGLRQLARFTMWRLLSEPAAALPDALALRSFALEAARTVQSASELLHGALAFCDENDLTVLIRALQAPLRVPADLERTTELLAAVIDRQGFHGLFDPSVPPTRSRKAAGVSRAPG